MFDKFTIFIANNKPQELIFEVLVFAFESVIACTVGIQTCAVEFFFFWKHFQNVIKPSLLPFNSNFKNVLLKVNRIT